MENQIAKEIVEAYNMLKTKVMITDLKGKIIFVNNYLCEYFQKKKEDIQELSIFDFVLPEEKKYTMETFQVFLETGENKIEKIKVLIDDKVHIFTISSSLKDNLIIHSLKDVTNSEKYKKDLEKNKELLKLLLSMIRHDLLNVLNGINSVSALINDDLDFFQPEITDFLENLKTEKSEIEEKINEIGDEIKKMIKKNLKKIDQEIKRGVRLINKTRDLESVGVSSDSNLNGYEIKKIIDNIIANCPSNIFFDVKGRGRALADEAIYSIFHNIMENGIKHGEATAINIEIEENGDAVKIKISNNGEYIDEDKIDNILNFEDGNIDPNSVHGIGLRIIKSNILRYGGSIEIKNKEKEKGVIYTIILKKI